MNTEFWTKYYKENKIAEPSTFAQYVLSKIEGELIDIGCGDGRDLFYFRKNGITAHGVDGSNEDVGIIKQNILSYIKENKSPDNVYARFFWHAIERKEQLEILKWTKKNILIEARTNEDKPKNIIGKHKRKLVNPKKLYRDLIDNGFSIVYWHEGRGLSEFRGEDPHLVRVIANKK
jgi:tellurite methyltransferase